VQVLVRADEPATSPLTERLRARVSWPPAARRPGEQADPLFPEGLAGAVELERAEPGTLAARVPPGQDDAFRAAVAAGGALLDAARTDPAAPALLPPRILSVSQVLTYARCPRDFYWSVVRPLPSPPRPAARLGSVVHRLLERRARNLPDLLDPDGLDDRPGGAAPPELVERAARNFAASRYAGLPAPEAEVGVVLRVGAWVIRGRIDAIFRPEGSGEPQGGAPVDREGSGEPQGGAPVDQPEGRDAGVELVDWKTGRQIEPPPGGLDQLGIYALALRQLGELPPAGCLASYCYLGGDQPLTDSRRLGPAELDQQRTILEATLAALASGDYTRACHRPDCDTCRRT
jgi:hypothetical protein